MLKNLNQIKDRYLREPFNKKLGHLASDLARIAGFLENSSGEKVALGVLEESKFFIEWVAPEADLELQELLSDMQSKLALWHYHLSAGKRSTTELKKLKEATKKWSEHLIEISGLLVET